MFMKTFGVSAELMLPTIEEVRQLKYQIDKSI
jgi:hypothetical protein